MSSWSSYLQGLKMAGGTEFLYDTAANFGLNLKVDHKDKGWLRETIYFTVTGDEQKINAFSRAMAQAIAEYNTPVTAKGHE